MENKLTKKYAEKLAILNNCVVADTDMAYINGYLKAIEETNVKEMREALIELLKGVNPQDACYGKFANYYLKGSKEYEAELTKPYVGSKSIPSDEQILQAINAINKATK